MQQLFIPARVALQKLVVFSFYHTTVTAFGRRTVSESLHWSMHSRLFLHVTLYIRQTSHFPDQQLNVVVIIKSTKNRKHENSPNNVLNVFSQFFPDQLTHCSKPNTIANIRMKIILVDVVNVSLI